MADVIGAARCPACRSERASLRLSAKGLPYLLCNSCNFQGFARSDRSDELLRGWLVATPAPVPAAVSPAAPVPAAAREVVAPPADAPRMGWGVLGVPA